MKMKGLIWLGMKFSIGSLCLFMTGQPVFAQVRIAWEARYNGPGNRIDWLTVMALDQVGNVYVTGESQRDYFSSDYATLKYDPHGNQLWEARYHGLGNRGNWASALTVDNDNNVYVTGSSSGVGTREDYATVKYDSQTGQLLWEARYNGPGNEVDSARAIAVDHAGNVYVTGFSTGIGTARDYATIKYDGQTGQMLWTARYNGPGNGDDSARAIAVDQEGDVYVTGGSTGVGTGQDYATIKYDGQTGQPLWIARYNGQFNGDDDAKLLALDREGSVYVAGNSSFRALTIRYDRHTGQARWIAPSGVELSALVVDEQGGVFVAGGTTSGDSIAIRYDPATGQAMWIQQIVEFSPVDLALDRFGDLYAVGISWVTAAIRLVKYDGRTGQVLWLNDYIVMGPEFAVATSVVVDKREAVYVGGIWDYNSVSDDYLVLKYEQAPPGDVNYDFCVDDVDLLRILLEFGRTGDLPEDVNRDGVVDDQDLLTVLFHFGSGC
jgi:hypothetical protein